MRRTVPSHMVAALGFLVASAVGVVTNVITDSFSWTLGGVLAVLVIVGMVIAATQHSGSSQTLRPRMRHRVGRKARVQDSPYVLGGDATVRERVLGPGEIVESGIDAATGQVTRRVRGKVSGSEITIKKPDG